MPQMAKFCQNGSCKKLANVQVHSPIPDLETKDGEVVQVTQRKLDLCAEDAAYFLNLRDEQEKSAPRVKKFVDNCHRN